MSFLRAVALTMASAMATGAMSMAAAQPRRGAHDLRDALLRRSGDQAATCVFCHAPQGRALAAQPPRWQRSGAQEVEFSLYGVTSVESVSMEGGASLLCLSCHDAGQAPLVIGASNDHPVGVVYAGIPGPRATLPALRLPRIVDVVDSRAHDLRAPSAPPSGTVAGFRAPSQGVINDRPVWWVATSPNSARRSRSDLPLYVNGEVSSGEALPTVECATCHDPHNDNEHFLRISNEGSRLCLSCHDL